MTVKTAVLKTHTMAIIVSDSPGRDQFTGKNPNTNTLMEPNEKKYK